MKILCSCRNMNHVAGGVERVLSSLMHELLARGHDISLITWDPENAIPFYKLDTRISWHKLSIGDSYKKASWKTRWQRAQKVRSIVRQEKPDVILTFQNGAFLSLWAYTLGMGVPVIVSERNAPTMYDFTKAGKYKFFWTRVYGLAPRVIIQTEKQKKMYPPWLQKKIDVISNPVFPVTSDTTNSSSDKKVILCVGRLDFQKNQKVLLESFSKIHSQCPEWSLRFIGSGKDLQSLKDQSRKNGVEAAVEFIGDVTDVSEHYKQAGIFCMPSRWEGFPNALAEALAYGVPAIGFSDCAGVNDLIEPGKNGQLAQGMDNADTLAKTLLDLIHTPSDRERMGNNARSITQAYPPAKIFDQWEQVLRQTAS